MSKPGIVNIRGKEYSTVALRVQKFREEHPEWTIKTEVKRLDSAMVLIEASIMDETGRLRSNGHAQEFQGDGDINRTAYVENCETSAIGRALAAFGMAGTEFASADELTNALTSKKGPVITPASGMFEKQALDMQNHLLDLAHRITALHKKGDIGGALDEWISGKEGLDEEQQAAAWTKLDSKVRSDLKREGEFRKEKEAA